MTLSFFCKRKALYRGENETEKKNEAEHLKRHGSSPKTYEKNEPVWNGGYTALHISKIYCNSPMYVWFIAYHRSQTIWQFKQSSPVTQCISCRSSFSHCAFIHRQNKIALVGCSWLALLPPSKYHPLWVAGVELLGLIWHIYICCPFAFRTGNP